jgi:hypothetical protein
MNNDRNKEKKELNSNEESISYPSPVWDRPQSRYGNNRWIAYSPRLQRNIILYSDLEYDHWVLVEANTSIKSFCEQPRRIRVQLPSGLVTTIFDMWILWETDRQEYREVKYLHELLRATPGSRTHRQIEAQKKWCELCKVDHTVITDELIRACPLLLSNWKVILSHLACTQQIELRTHIDNIGSWLLNTGGGSLKEIEASFPHVDRSLVRSSVFTLLHGGQLRAPLDVKPLNTSTLFDVVL